jgi:hypothetical protein
MGDYDEIDVAQSVGIASPARAEQPRRRYAIVCLEQRECPIKERVVLGTPRVQECHGVLPCDRWQPHAYFQVSSQGRGYIPGRAPVTFWLYAGLLVVGVSASGMATAHISSSQFAASRAAAPSQRRRAPRQPAGWLEVEAEIARTGRRVPGRLLDTSAGGLGLVLSERLALGTALRILSADGGGDAPAWRQREARVVYAASLPGGSWRIGLAYTFARPTGLQIWATRLVLLASLVAAVATAIVTQGASMMASTIVALVVLFLAVGAEWQHRSELYAYRREMKSTTRERGESQAA